MFRVQYRARISRVLSKSRVTSRVKYGYNLSECTYLGKPLLLQWRSGTTDIVLAWTSTLIGDGRRTKGNNQNASCEACERVS